MSVVLLGVFAVAFGLLVARLITSGFSLWLATLGPFFMTFFVVYLTQGSTDPMWGKPALFSGLTALIAGAIGHIIGRELIWPLPKQRR